MFTITDTITGVAHTNVPGEALERVLRTLFVEGTDRAVAVGIYDLAHQARQGEYTGELEAFLSVRVERTS